MFEIKIQIGGQGMRIQEIWILKSLRMVAREGWRGRRSQGHQALRVQGGVAKKLVDDS